MSESIALLIEGRERFLQFIRRRMSDPELAEDILQESLLKAVRAAPTLREEESLISWFFTILRNAVTDAYRRGAQTPVTTDLSLAKDVAMSEEEQRAACACFEALLPSLKPEYGELLQAIDLGDESAEQVRGQLGLTATNLKVRHHRAPGVASKGGGNMPSLR